MSEGALVRDLIYVFQDIEGKYIRFSPKDNAFRIQPQVSSLAEDDGLGFALHLPQFSRPSLIIRKVWDHCLFRLVKCIQFEWSAVEFLFNAPQNSHEYH